MMALLHRFSRSAWYIIVYFLQNLQRTRVEARYICTVHKRRGHSQRCGLEARWSNSGVQQCRFFRHTFRRGESVKFWVVLVHFFSSQFYWPLFLEVVSSKGASYTFWFGKKFSWRHCQCNSARCWSPSNAACAEQPISTWLFDVLTLANKNLNKKYCG